MSQKVAIFDCISKKHPHIASEIGRRGFGALCAEILADKFLGSPVRVLRVDRPPFIPIRRACVQA